LPMNACISIFLVAGLSLAAVAVAGAAPVEADLASGDSSEHFAAGSAAFSAGDYAKAAAEFEAAHAAGMSGPAVQYNSAVAYYRLGDFAQAADAFRAVAERYPQMGALAEYNLGLALLKQQRPDEAHAAFERARQGGDPTIAALAARMLAREGDDLRDALRAPAWVKLFDFAVGYDDNVALIEESSLPAGISTGSQLTEAFGLISGKLGPHEAVRLDASAYLVRYRDAP